MVAEIECGLYDPGRDEEIHRIMKDNYIAVPRMRGGCYMKYQTPLNQEQIDVSAKSIGLFECESACESNFRMHSWCYELSERTRRIKRKYLVFDEYYNPTDIRWDRIHGKKRKVFKYKMKMARKRVLRDVKVFNQYAGRDDIIRIYARIGGKNWPYYGKNVKNRPWFIEKIDDPFDSTYCDIYCKVEVKTDETKANKGLSEKDFGNADCGS